MKYKYERKVKGLILAVIILPMMIFNISVFFHMLSRIRLSNDTKPILIFMGMMSTQAVITYFFFRRLPVFLSEESACLEKLTSSEFLYPAYDEKIRQIIKVKEQLNALIMTVSNDIEASIKEIEQKERLETETSDINKALKEQIELQMILNDTLIQLSPQFIIQINAEGIIMKVNQSLLQRLGYFEEDVVGQNLVHFIKSDEPGDSEAHWLSKVIQAQHEPLFVYMSMKASTLTAYEYLSITTTQLSDGTYLCVARAINDEIALQSNILRKNRELEYINQINASLISNWGIEALLDNIIRRMDYLFNIRMGCIFVLDSNKSWVLKSYTSKQFSVEDKIHEDWIRYFTEERLKDFEIQSIEINHDTMRFLVLSPLEVSGETIAIMAIALQNEMGSNDINILKMFKNQASMVIQRALIYEQLQKQYFGTIEALVNVIEAKDKYTEGHSRRVSRFAVEIAKEMSYSNEEIENIEIAGLLHDIGKIGIDQNILAKRGQLTKEEYEVIKTHPSKGIAILEAINFDQNIKDGILYHHARYDLKGYPENQLKKLPKYACLIGAADAFDAITSARSYSSPRGMDQAIQELIKHEGTQFDPEMVQVIKKIIDAHPERLQSIIDDIETTIS